MLALQEALEVEALSVDSSSTFDLLCPLESF
jgi:hypothetical protein